MSGRLVDAALMCTVDVFLALPNLVLILVLLAILGSGFINLVIAVASSFAMSFARLARSYILDARRRPVVIAAGWPASRSGASPLPTSSLRPPPS